MFRLFLLSARARVRPDSYKVIGRSLLNSKFTAVHIRDASSQQLASFIKFLYKCKGRRALTWLSGELATYRKDRPLGTFIMFDHAMTDMLGTISFVTDYRAVLKKNGLKGYGVVCCIHANPATVKAEEREQVEREFRMALFEHIQKWLDGPDWAFFVDYNVYMVTSGSPEDYASMQFLSIERPISRRIMKREIILARTFNKTLRQ